ncbi:MAG: NAD(P)H-dependent glycerol-3-phosphate dehydrogenase [Beijerinckiaceae bacterium]
MTAFQRIAVIGAGAWGTALANAMARTGRPVKLIARDSAHAAAMQRDRINAKRLPGVTLDPAVSATAILATAAESDLILLVTPAQTIRAMAQGLQPHLRPGTPVVLCAKGIERGTGLLPADILAATLPEAVPAVLSGPSFAADVSRGLPTAVVLACAQDAMARSIATTLSSSTLRLYHGTDVRGVEIGGAAKNVLAIGAGIVIGRGLGESAKAALIARGFAELMRFALACGAKAETLMGLSGLGDLVLTCGSEKSRNFAFGAAIGRGEAVAEARTAGLAEGAYSASALLDLARQKSIAMPVSETVAALIDGVMTVDDAVAALMARPVKAEH